MKILLIVGDTIRDYNTMRYIYKHIVSFSPNAQVKILSCSHKKLLEKTLNFCPDTVLVGAMTTMVVIKYCYMIKSKLNCRVISFMAEGALTLVDTMSIQAYAGRHNYGPHLVDAFLFFGDFPKIIIGNELINENKCSSIKRLHTCGYVHLEFYINEMYTFIPEDVQIILDKYEKNNICMFLTGFQGTDYRVKEIFQAEDMLDMKKNIEEQLDFLVSRNMFYTEKRELYIEQICVIARRNPDMLFIVKTHPGEQFCHNVHKHSLYDDYEDTFRNIENIILLDGNLHIGSLLKCVGAMVHYGSSSLIFTYFSDVYTICFPFYETDSNQLEQRIRLGWRSDVEVGIEGIEKAICDYKEKKLHTSSRTNLKKLLAKMYNYHEGIAYTPAAEVARLLTTDGIITYQELESSPLDMQYRMMYM